MAAWQRASVAACQRGSLAAWQSGSVALHSAHAAQHSSHCTLLALPKHGSRCADDSPHRVTSPLVVVCSTLVILCLSLCGIGVKAANLCDLLPPGQSCMDETGFELRTLQTIWDKYHAFGGSRPGTFGGQVAEVQRGGLLRRAYHFLCVFIYIHKLPQNNWAECFKLPNGPDKWFTMAKTHWQPMHDVASALSNIISEIDYDDRLHPCNHWFAPFKYHYTGMVDVCPIYVPTPHHFSESRLLFQPKYEACVFKLQVGISFMGNIILWTGPHLGCTSDKTIWDQTWAAHPFFPWEWWLADLGYLGALGLIVKYKRAAQQPGQPAPPQLTNRQLFFNNTHAFLRNRLEQIMDVIKSHRLFAKRVYQGSYEHLLPLVTIVGHATALELAVRQRFVTYGPWQHAY